MQKEMQTPISILQQQMFSGEIQMFSGKILKILKMFSGEILKILKIVFVSYVTRLEQNHFEAISNAGNRSIEYTY